MSDQVAVKLQPLITAVASVTCPSQHSDVTVQQPVQHTGTWGEELGSPDGNCFLEVQRQTGMSLVSFRLLFVFMREMDTQTGIYIETGRERY